MSYPSLAHLNIPVRFSEDHFDKLRVLQSVQKVGVETVKVGLDADAFHHQVLGHPGHEFILHRLLQLLHLDRASGFRSHIWTITAPKLPFDSKHQSYLTFCVMLDCERLLKIKAIFSWTFSGGSTILSVWSVATNKVSMLVVFMEGCRGQSTAKE